MGPILDGVSDPHAKGQLLGERHASLILELCTVIVYRVEYRISTQVSIYSISMQPIQRYGITV